MGGTGRPLGKTFFLQCQRRHPELPKIPTYLPVLGGLEHGCWVVGEGAVLLSDRGDGAVAGVGHGVVEVADGLLGEFMLCIPFVFLGNALLPVDVPLLQVCPDVGHLLPAVVDVSAGLGGVGLEEGRQLLLRIPEVMEHVP